MTEPAPRTAPPLLFLLTTAFLFSIGMTLVFPVLPFIVMQYVPDVPRQAGVIGALTAVFALLSFFSAPVMGALSDAYGRRPVLLVSLLGSAVGYVLFGIGGSLWILFLGRAIDGLTAGGMSALFGYIADHTSREERGKVFGQIGATVGAGFIIGPAIGGLLSHLSLSAPMYAAAAVCVLNTVWGALAMRETRPARSERTPFTAAHLNPLLQLRGVLAYPVIRRLVTVSVLFIVPFSIMGVSNALLARDVLGWGPGQVSTLFIVVGVADIIAQGFLLPHLIRWLGERGVAQLGLGLGATGLVCLALLPVLAAAPLAYVGVLLFATGEGIFNAALGTLLSISAPDDAQGRVQGGSQAFGSLSQIAGPLAGGALYSRLGPGATYAAGAAMVLVALAVLTGSRTPATPHHEVEAAG
ncbi:DHA1 family tetracycline resistance protein-like MFS transporter [Deinococcus metalli]|uniref:DHA1 family tetracycline resistance protein-like MFS transporter n=1 Tax=Deinococcus metalli TaxID=1141878 RepID=A0A7W8KHR4_9DEIO|nr:MFS transporter [Deinococcus metalli]MBB5378401.1 DHA1 family tetracycline resistance protein-like MFS transporter [Deinococcus metalli]GHF59212.1 tetracycline resistance MFS efflux pump [Deinococcus metalli]